MSGRYEMDPYKEAVEFAKAAVASKEADASNVGKVIDSYFKKLTEVKEKYETPQGEQTAYPPVVIS